MALASEIANSEYENKSGRNYHIDGIFTEQWYGGEQEWLSRKCKCNASIGNYETPERLDARRYGRNPEQFPDLCVVCYNLENEPIMPENELTPPDEDWGWLEPDDRHYWPNS